MFSSKNKSETPEPRKTSQGHKKLIFQSSATF